VFLKGFYTGYPQVSVDGCRQKRVENPPYWVDRKKGRVQNLSTWIDKNTSNYPQNPRLTEQNDSVDMDVLTQTNDNPVKQINRLNHLLVGVFARDVYGSGGVLSA